MVAANKNLLKLVRKLAVRDELQAMRLRGRLVAPMKPMPVPESAQRQGLTGVH